jgi:hypothetical protein
MPAVHRAHEMLLPNVVQRADHFENRGLSRDRGGRRARAQFAAKASARASRDAANAKLNQWVIGIFHCRLNVP